MVRSLEREKAIIDEAVVLRAGNVCLDYSGHRLTLDGRAVRVTYQEFQVLGVLMEHAGEVVTHESFCEAIWGSSGGRENKRLSVIISRLRQKLDGAAPYTIEAVRSRGYGLLLGSAAESRHLPRTHTVARSLDALASDAKRPGQPSIAQA